MDIGLKPASFTLKTDNSRNIYSERRAGAVTLSRILGLPRRYRGVSAGVISLISVIVGVIIVGVLAATVLPIVIQTVPWTQDTVAQQSLGEFKTAQSAALAKEGHYLTDAELVEYRYLQAGAVYSADAALSLAGGRGTGVRGPAPTEASAANSVSSTLADDKTCFVAAVESATGAMYWTTSNSPQIHRASSIEETPTSTDCHAEFPQLRAATDVPTPTPPPAITPNSGIVSTLAGTGTTGFRDGSGSQAQFNHPNGLALDTSGNLYVADRSNYRLRKVEADGTVTTVTWTNGSGVVAPVEFPTGVYSVAIGPDGSLYIAGGTGNRVQKLTASGALTDVATFATLPTAVAVDHLGNVFVTLPYAHTVVKVTPAGAVTTFAGSGLDGQADGTGAAASFSNPNSIAIDSVGNIFVADTNNCVIRKITPESVVSTFAGNHTCALVNGAATGASFNLPTAVAVGPDGAVYASGYDYVLREVTSSGEVSTLAGSGTTGFVDGPGASARFGLVMGLAVDDAGVIYASDFMNNRIRLIK